MNKNTNESWNYAKYRTFCVLPEEMIREYGRAAWMEKADELYEKVKRKIMELPIAEAEKQMKQVDAFFQSVLEGKEFFTETISSSKKTIIEKDRKPKQESSFFVKEHVLGAEKKTTGNTVTSNEEKTTKKTVQRPLLSLTGTCPKCKKKSYLQFTDGYFCGSCNVLYVNGVMDDKKKDLQERMNKVLFEHQASPDKTIQELKTMLVKDPNSAQLYERLGLAYRQKGDNESAMKYYQKALELDDRDGVIYCNMGVIFILQGNYHQAKEYLEKAYVCWNADNYTNWSPQIMFSNYSIALHKTGNQEKAFVLLKKAFERGYEDCDAVFMQWGVGKELCSQKIQQLMNNPQSPYSINLKKDI